MKPNNTATHRTPEANSAASTAFKSTDRATESSHPMVQLKAVPANGHIVQERGRKVYSILKGESNE
jgi:hypothetical protein